MKNYNGIMYTFYGVITSGQLEIKNRGKVLKDFSVMKDGQVRIEVKYKSKRSLPQNSYYHGVIVWEIRKRLEELGNIFSADDVHSFLKDRFNSKMIIGPGGEVLGEVGGSTADLSKEEFGLYIDKIISWSSEFLDLSIPLPNTSPEIF